MSTENTRKTSKFFGKLSKATVVMLLPLSFAVSASGLTTGAEASMDPPKKPAEQKTPIVQVAAENPAKRPFIEVDFKDSVDPDKLAEFYPFTKDAVEQVKTSNALKDTATPTEIFVAKIEDTKNNVKMLLLNFRGSDFCGTMGCYLSVFSDNGEGYKEIHGTALDGPLYVMRSEKGLSLIFCRDGGRPEELLLKNQKFERNSTQAVLEAKPPICTP